MGMNVKLEDTVQFGIKHVPQVYDTATVYVASEAFQKNAS